MTMVRNGVGIPILCVWDDCQKPGHDEIKAVVEDGFDPQSKEVKHLHYIFCSERHKAYWMNSHRDMGNLPAGMANRF